ncbi:FtsK/SpoIIIE family DNA translocase [Anaplasma capra]|uniref:FtsK/SpoIIIE family DNA translocase n=1 Tax=Anaplasma capra TaxID=1562740 RepID=UPI0021D59691|nr:DNA translocase FtsK 4TM domain-containing protein [Anaplasma capra]MCU7611375.1 DNA translocase FtsK 4TM domain-containing protein [Anaplasma capra]MCU7612449.1 DNA translocase FtsK 4TM domain-containing protein [Anaplasma capra]
MLNDRMAAWCRVTLCFLATAFIALSVITYSPSDTSLNTSGMLSDVAIQNLMGIPGAYVGDLAVQLFGFSGALSGIFMFSGLKRAPAFVRKVRVLCVLCVTSGIGGVLSKLSLGVTSKFQHGGFVGSKLAALPISVLAALIIVGVVGSVGWGPIVALYGLVSKFKLRVSGAGGDDGYGDDLLMAEEIPHSVEYPTLLPTLQSFTQVATPMQRQVIPQHPVQRPQSSSQQPRSADHDVGLQERSAPTRQPHVEKKGVAAEFVLPEVKLLAKRTPPVGYDGGVPSHRNEADALYSVLKDFGVYGKIIDVRYGPVVTLYEFEPSAGTKSSRVIGLSDDIARSMSALSTRISVIPGRNVLGIEIPNQHREIVMLRDLVESSEYADPDLKLPIILGKGIDGEAVVADLTKMPHLLIAGTTGSGKSVGINTMILSLLYRLTPVQCRMIMIDPKVLELSIYDNIPHLLTPVVTGPKKAVAVLKWVVSEMEERYRLMSAVGVRNITGYNAKIVETIKSGATLERVLQTGFDANTGEPVFERTPIEKVQFPYIVVVVDEMADLMIVSGKEIESSIQRLSQMARAAGIHIIMATQRPSVDVITGVIKANFPTRVSFSVTSKIDSRTILGEQGAEQLLGMGDMLYMVSGGRIRRVHGAFVSDNEVQDVVNHLKMQGKPDYIEDIAKVLEHEERDGEDFRCYDDSLYEKAVAIVLRDRKTSISYVQRQLRIGYNRAANLIERMEREGVITQGKREIVE